MIRLAIVLLIAFLALCVKAVYETYAGSGWRSGAAYLAVAAVILLAVRWYAGRQART